MWLVLLSCLLHGDSRDSNLTCVMSSLESGDLDDVYLQIRFLFDEFTESDERASIYYLRFMVNMSALLRRTDLNDSARLEICHGIRRIPTVSGPLVPALNEYLKDLRNQKANIKSKGLHGGTGKSSIEFVRETIEIVRRRQR